VKAELHEALQVAVPLLVKQLEHGNLGVRVTASSLLSNLAKYGELHLYITWTLLMWM
jgi:hypothetical protein